MDEFTATEKALLALGKTQVDVMFSRQEDGPVIDDSEFLPMLEAILTAFEAHGLSEAGADELWDHAFHTYDKACREAVPTSTVAENRDLMRSYLLGPRGLRKRAGKGSGHT
jgi:hypothetical protein